MSRELTNDDKKSTPVWPLHEDKSQLCNQLRGTDGTFFGPYLKQNDVLHVFEPQICRFKLNSSITKIKII